MAKKVEKPKISHDLNAFITTRNETRIIAAYRYYSINDTLRTFGVDRQAAMDAAKWCSRAKAPMTKKLGDVTISLKEMKDG